MGKPLCHADDVKFMADSLERYRFSTPTASVLPVNFFGPLNLRRSSPSY